MNIKKISKKISVVLFIALMPNLFFTACANTNSNPENIENTPDNSTLADNISENSNQPAVAKFIYEGDFSSAFSNPERGYYKRADVTKSSDFSYVSDLNITIVHSYIPIYNYLNLTKENPWNENITEKLPAVLLENLQTGLDAIRNAGLKVILRPAYAWDWTPPIAEHWNIIQNHLAQINNIISKNADIVMGLETGVLGPWGEWHSDGIYTDANSQKGADFRYELFKYILDITPDNLPVMLRYPYFIKEMRYLGVNPPESQNNMTETQLYRIGYHDDSFMTDENDWGSYNPRQVWWGKLNGLKSNNISNAMFRQWMKDEMYNSNGGMMMGGETEWDDKATLKHENSIAPLRVLQEMSDMQTTYMSTDYNPKHIDLWRETNIPASDKGEPAETVYERIERRLGYRLRLIDAEFTTSQTAGGEFKIDFTIINDGFAGIIKGRPLYVVFDDGANRYDIFLYNTNVYCLTSEENKINAVFELPEEMQKGVYTVALWLPDPAENLHARPEYSVRFANKNVWDNKKGYNKLGEIVVY